MLVLNDKQVKELEAFIQELPVKFGVPLINLLRKFAEEAVPKELKSEPEAQAAKPVELEAQ